MNKKDLKKLSKSELIKLLLKQEKKKPKVVIVDDTKPVPTPSNKVNQLVQFFENKPVPRKSVNKDIILPPPKGFRDRPPKPTGKPPPPPNDGFNFYDDIFQTENTSLGKFKIISVQSRENK